MLIPTINFATLEADEWLGDDKQTKQVQEACQIFVRTIWYMSVERGVKEIDGKRMCAPAKVQREFAHAISQASAYLEAYTKDMIKNASR
jgi:hypothetical protein